MNQERLQSGHPSSSANRNHSPPSAPDDVSAVDDQSFANERTGSKRKRLTKQLVLTLRPFSLHSTQLPLHSYFASKVCTYTDSQGRPVPAPKVANEQSPLESSQPGLHQSTSLGDIRAPQQPLPTWNASADGPSPRKRLRTSASGTSLGYPVDYLASQNKNSIEPRAAVQLDNALVRELAGLFFTHCHPARIIFHKPTFSAALTHGVVPPYLVFAMCALAAPLSKQPALRTNPARFAGRPFAQEALSLMFDGAGRLMCEPSLATAQALCLLQIHDTRIGGPTSWNMRYHDLNFQVCDRLGVHSNESSPFPAVGPSSAHIEAVINKECLRRVYWLMYLLDILVSVYVKGPRHWQTADPRLRLPWDETAFELAVGTTPADEYLHLPPAQNSNASEIGHLIRVATIWAELEFVLDDLETHPPDKTHVRNLELRLNAWEASLPPRLRFTDEVLAIQQTMLETSSNNGSWCWANMHMYRASCALLLHKARRKGLVARPAEGRAEENEVGGTVDRREGAGAHVAEDDNGQDEDAPPTWPVKTLQAIVRMFGDRAKNSSILGNVIWLLIKHCRPDDEEIMGSIRELEDLWGAYTEGLARDLESASSSSSREASRTPVPVTPPEGEGSHEDKEREESTPRIVVQQLEPLESPARSVTPPSPVEAPAKPSENMDTVQPSGLPGYIFAPDPEDRSREDAHQPAERRTVAHTEHAPSHHPQPQASPPARHPAFSLPSLLQSPSTSSSRRPSLQNLVGFWPEPRSRAPAFQRVPSPLKLPEDWGHTPSERDAPRRGSYDDHWDRPGTSYCAPGARPYAEEVPAPYPPRRLTYPSDTYYAGEPSNRDDPGASTDARALPSLRSSGLLSGPWEHHGPPRHSDAYARPDFTFASNAPARAEPPPPALAQPPTLRPPFDPRAPSSSSRPPYPPRDTDHSAPRWPATGWYPDVHLPAGGAYAPRAPARAGSFASAQPSSAPAGLPWLAEEQPPAG
ncbi:fungal-specific transcription factor domain-containing protein [Schizophyllum fasciatum]